MELSLKENFLLINYDPVKGSSRAGSFLGYGIAGAILMELAEMKKIRIEDKRIILSDRHHCNDPILDAAIDIISKSNKPMRIRTLLGKIQHRPKVFKKPLVESLVKKRYLKEVRKKFLFIPYRMYPSGNISYSRNLKESIRRLVLKNEGDSKAIAMLCGLAGACKFSHKFFKAGEERKKAKVRIKKIVEESQIDKTIDQTIREIQAAILISVSAAAVATTSS